MPDAYHARSLCVISRRSAALRCRRRHQRLHTPTERVPAQMWAQSSPFSPGADGGTASQSVPAQMWAQPVSQSRRRCGHNQSVSPGADVGRRIIFIVLLARARLIGHDALGFIPGSAVGGVSPFGRVFVCLCVCSFVRALASSATTRSASLCSNATKVGRRATTETINAHTHKHSRTRTRTQTRTRTLTLTRTHTYTRTHAHTHTHTHTAAAHQPISHRPTERRRNPFHNSTGCICTLVGVCVCVCV